MIGFSGFSNIFQGEGLMKSTMLAFAAAALVAGPVAAQVPTGTMDALRPDQQQFFTLYKELVETDTTVSSGDCTQA